MFTCMSSEIKYGIIAMKRTVMKTQDNVCIENEIVQDHSDKK